MHDALTVGIPVFVILLGILLNQRGLDRLEARLDGRINGLEGRMNGFESRLDRMQSDITARLDRMQADLSMFYRTLGQHDADIEHLKKNRNA
ncbi:MAG TPA: hypothetical protein VH250_09290 [Granulicella sp.]|nr:hypothetical protein [Granulicella sp.]